MKKFLAVLFTVTILMTLFVMGCDTKKDDNNQALLLLLLASSSQGCYIQHCSGSNCLQSTYVEMTGMDESGCTILGGVLRSRPTTDLVCNTPIVGACTIGGVGATIKTTYYQYRAACAQQTYSDIVSLCGLGTPSHN